MDIKTLLVLNNIGLIIAVVALSVLMVLLIRSEKKLVKHGESWFFKKKNK